ncbi:MAG: DUF502 domain-containing protein [Candidatus Margulisbacteria bacterium]|nr:DUF502 domain-containing protein [Candidatus Margulisiibacteriota bacterium]
MSQSNGGNNVFSDESLKKKGIMSRIIDLLKKDFMYGLIIILPTIVTIWLVSFTIRLISGPLSNLLGQRTPEFVSFIITIVIITLIGIVTRNILGKALFHFMENLMHRIPIINRIYKSTKQIISSLSMKDKKMLSAVLVEYPRKEMWALAFITQDHVEGLLDENGQDIGHDKLALFIPTTPNPTSGYFVYVPKKDVIRLGFSVEQSVKILMSAGVVNPEGPE